MLQRLSIGWNTGYETSFPTVIVPDIQSLCDALVDCKIDHDTVPVIEASSESCVRDLIQPCLPRQLTSACERLQQLVLTMVDTYMQLMFDMPTITVGWGNFEGNGYELYRAAKANARIVFEEIKKLLHPRHLARATKAELLALCLQIYGVLCTLSTMSLFNTGGGYEASLELQEEFVRVMVNRMTIIVERLKIPELQYLQSKLTGEGFQSWWWTLRSSEVPLLGYSYDCTSVDAALSEACPGCTYCVQLEGEQPIVDIVAEEPVFSTISYVATEESTIIAADLTVEKHQIDNVEIYEGDVRVNCGQTRADDLSHLIQPTEHNMQVSRDKEGDIKFHSSIVPVANDYFDFADSWNLEAAQCLNISADPFCTQPLSQLSDLANQPLSEYVYGF